jgi:hypothetical protein
MNEWMFYELAHAAKIALRVVVLKARCNNSGPSVGILLWFLYSLVAVQRDSRPLE